MPLATRASCDGLPSALVIPPPASASTTAPAANAVSIPGMVLLEVQPKKLEVRWLAGGPFTKNSEQPLAGRVDIARIVTDTTPNRGGEPIVRRSRASAVPIA